jgi:hypothetical protein
MSKEANDERTRSDAERPESREEWEEYERRLQAKADNLASMMLSRAPSPSDDCRLAKNCRLLMELLECGLSDIIRLDPSHCILMAEVLRLLKVEEQ